MKVKKGSSLPLAPVEPKLSPAEKKLLLQRQRFTAIRDLQRDAKKGNKKVWARLSDTTAHHKHWKTLIRDYVKRVQDPRCCYCKRWLLNNAYASPIEHVLPSSLYPAHVLRLKNLAMACHDCNHLKGNQDWNTFVGPHPPGEWLVFFHPRYHAYQDHIDYFHYETNDLEYLSYHGLTKQGRHLCQSLLSNVVGKKRLEGSFPGLQKWIRATESLDKHVHVGPERPELEMFGRMLSQSITEQLDDGAKISAMWVLK